MDVRVGCGLVHPVPATGAADGRVVHAVGDHGGAAVMDALRELGGEAHHVGHGGRVLAEQVVNLTCREEGERGVVREQKTARMQQEKASIGRDVGR